MATIINKNYEYDVAFSFVEDDEDLANQINDLIKSRVKTFIYSEHQKELAGTDGEETFNRVFETEARIVVILYRKKWGTTPWTRIEERAIKNRGFEESYDFVVLIPLDKPPITPKWMAKNQVWVDINRWGIEGALSVIETRVREFGGTPREETIEEYAVRKNQEMERKQKQRDFLQSTKGVQAAEQEFKNIFLEVKRLSETISDDDSKIKFNVEDFYIKNFKIYTNKHFSVSFFWECTYSNTLEGSVLSMHLLKEPIRFADRERPTQLKEEEFNFEIRDSGEYGWRMKTGDKRFYSSKQLADYSVKTLIDEFQ